jgi:hypothetical protein
MDPEPDPAIIKQNGKKTIDSYCFVTSLWLVSLKNDGNVPSKSNKQKKLWNSNSGPLVRGMDLRIRIRTKISWIRNTA